MLFLFPFFFGITFSQAETIFNLQDTILTRDKNDVSYLVQELDEVLVSPSKFLESSREISKKVVSINQNTVDQWVDRRIIRVDIAKASLSDTLN